VHFITALFAEVCPDDDQWLVEILPDKKNTTLICTFEEHL
jgi:hypothetical protein